jgi:hypothetical protein
MNTRSLVPLVGLVVLVGACREPDPEPTPRAAECEQGADVDADGIVDACDSSIGACGGVWPEVVAVTEEPHATLATAAHLSVTLDVAASLAVACTRDADPTDVVFYESEATTAQHELTIYGLVPSSTYTCDVVAVCPQTAAPHTFTVVTRAVSSDVPTATVTVDPSIETTGPPFLLTNYDPFCTGGTPGMVVYDLNGDIRWYYEDIPDIDNAYETQYLGGGRFSWGGGFYNYDPPEIVDLDGLVTYRAPGGMLYHHDGKVLSNGTMLAMTIESNEAFGAQWDGFGLYMYDMATDEVVWSYNSERAALAGDLPTGSGDPWHANWADLVESDAGDRVAVSLCALGDIIAIDYETKDVVWRLGNGGDFEVRDADGRRLSAFDGFSQCQHGLELVGDELLVYDNGQSRGYTRISEYHLDETTWTATLMWTWTEPEFFEAIWGDVDHLPGGHVLATMAHVECWAYYPGDKSSSVEIDPVTGKVPWRLELDDPNDANYRSERIDACDAFPLAAFCPEVATRFAELAPLFDPCAAGADADLDRDGYTMCGGDCADRDPAVHPGAADECDGVDNDCDGVRDDGFASAPIWLDRDGDGFGDAASPDTACVVPAGYASVDGDCDDGDPASWPGAPEGCDEADNDCDGAIDEIPQCFGCEAVGDLLGCSGALSWGEAADACVSFGASLVSISDATENAAAAAFRGERWIGANDRNNEGTWIWADGTPFGYTNWYAGEPNDAGGEDCVGINYGRDGSWNDYNCETRLGFVCAY